MASSTARFERLTTFSRPVGDLPVRDASGFELVPSTEDALATFHRESPQGLNARKLAVLRGRLGTAEQGWLLRAEDGRWAGWCHLVRGSGPNSRIHHTLRLRPDEVFLFDDRTLPEFRRRGLHAFSIVERLRLAAADDATGAVTTITNTNTASKASYRRVGFVPRSQLLHVPRLGRTVELPLTPAWVKGARDGRRPRR